MSDPLTHAAAFKSLLSANPPLTGKVVDTVKVNNQGGLVRENYAVVYMGGPASLDDDRYTAPQRADSKSEWEPTVRYVGIDADSARRMFSAGQTALIGNVPAVAGRVCTRVKFISSDEVQEDRNATPSLFYVDVDYGFMSFRA